MLPRPRRLRTLRQRLSQGPVVAILGPRQVGKTTLARMLLDEWEGPRHLFDLEWPDDRARLGRPSLALGPLEGLVVLDEIQQMPELFEILRVLADRPERPATFLVLGSASPDLVRETSETLAGRVSFVRVDGFAVDEVGNDEVEKLWVRGGFPRSFLAPDEPASFQWREDFVQTFLTRDLPTFGIGVAAPTMRRFWTMLAHYHGQTWNGSEIGRSLGVAHTTTRTYLDHLEQAFVVRTLQPWFANLKKRQVKSPKVYIADSGLLHTLLRLPDRRALLGHPKAGASFEGFAIGAVLEQLRVGWSDAYFWATHAGAELDLFVPFAGRRLGFEVKLSSAPKVTRSMHVALDDLELDRIDVVHTGKHTFPLHEQIRALSIHRLLEHLEPLR